MVWGKLPPVSFRVDLTGTTRVGAVMVLVSARVWPVRVVMVAVRARGAPVKESCSGWAAEDALTSLR